MFVGGEKIVYVQVNIGKHGHIYTNKYINFKIHNLTQIPVYYLFFIKTILPVWGKIIHQAAGVYCVHMHRVMLLLQIIKWRFEKYFL